MESQMDLYLSLSLLFPVLVGEILPVLVGTRQWVCFVFSLVLPILLVPPFFLLLIWDEMGCSIQTWTFFAAIVIVIEDRTHSIES